MNAYYPIFLDLSIKKILIIGGGKVALQKIQLLLKHQAWVQVVTKNALPQIQSWAQQKRIQLSIRPFKQSDLKNKDIVICATHDEKFNQKIGWVCRKKKILVNVVDRPLLCDFIVPSIVRKGEVTFAISTGGASPALAQFLRKRLDQLFDARLMRIASKLKKMRPELKKFSMQERKKITLKLIQASGL